MSEKIFSEQTGKTYPPGTTFNDWTIVSDTKYKGAEPVLYVRRWLYYADSKGPLDSKGKPKKKDFERYPRTHEYAHLRSGPDENGNTLQDFVTRLNNRLPEVERTRKKVEIKWAFTRPELVTQFISHMKTNIEPEDANRIGRMLKKYCIGFFSDRLGIMDPLEWHKNQSIWGQALLNEFNDEEVEKRGVKGIAHLRIWPKDHIPADSTIRKCVYAMNAFMTFLHQQYPEEYKPLKFAPITKSRFRKLRGTRKAEGLVRPRRYIPDAMWEEIYKEIQKDRWAAIRGQVLLGYYFGARVGESGALTPNDLHKDHLKIRLQIDSVTTNKQNEKVIKRKVVKGRLERRIEFWFPGWTPTKFQANDVYQWISQAQANPMHPDTLSEKWNLLMARLDMPFQFHDLRRTFITNAFRVGRFKNYDVMPGDVQLVAGHANITTTMRYKLDPRELSEEKYNPAFDVLESETDDVYSKDE